MINKITKEIIYATFDKNVKAILRLKLGIFEHVEIGLSAISSSVPILFKLSSHDPSDWPNMTWWFAFSCSDAWPSSIKDNAYRWHEDNAKKRGRKKEAHKRNEALEKGEYNKVSGAFLN